MLNELRVQPTQGAYALIVGISQYRDPSIRPLKYTNRDAQALAELLVDPQQSGFPKENVKLLLDEQATLFNVKHAISTWLFQKASRDSTVVVFFASHGGLESDKAGEEKDGIAKYLLPWDANPQDLFASALSNSEFERLLSTIKAERLVIFMDCCYAGGVSMRRGARDLGLVENPCQRLGKGSGRLVIGAAQPNQQSWEDPAIEHGIFTYHLIEALRGKADADNDGCVSVCEIYKYLERTVPESARRLANSLQDPFLCGDLSKDIVLTVNAARIAQISAEIQEAQRRVDQDLQKKRRKLFELFDSQELPKDAYREALDLVDKDPAELTPGQKRLSGLLNALLSGGINGQLYVESREAILGTPHVAPQSRQAAPPPVQHPPQIAKFCIRCGKQLRPQHAFCIGCGSPVPLSQRQSAG